MSRSLYLFIEKWLANFLEPVRKLICRYSLHDYFEFIENIEEVNVSDKIILSLNVESLLTNVPLIEIISFICKYINNNEMNIGIPEAYLKELLRCTRNVQPTFNDVIHRQKDDIAMISLLCLLLADCFIISLGNN